MIKIAASILSADFAHLGEQVQEAEAAGADYIHVDVMDGHFVPNITIGPLVVEAVRHSTGLPLDVHLMIEKPERYLANFAEAGADIISVHTETCPHLHRTVQMIKELGCKASTVINPATPLAALEEILPFVDQVLVMTVNPGFGGQSFIVESLSKLERLRAWRDKCNPACEIEVDGGINVETAPLVVQAGAQVLVAGSAIFNEQASVATNIRRLRDSALSATPTNRGESL